MAVVRVGFTSRRNYCGVKAKFSAETGTRARKCAISGKIWRNPFKVNLTFLPSVLGSVTPRDSGFYSCAAVSASGSSLARAEIKIVTSAERPPPLIQLGPVNQTLPLASATSMHCQTSSSQDKVTWLKDGVPISTLGDSRIAITNDNTLHIKGIIFCQGCTNTYVLLGPLTK